MKYIPIKIRLWVAKKSIFIEYIFIIKAEADNTTNPNNLIIVDISEVIDEMLLFFTMLLKVTLR